MPLGARFANGHFGDVYDVYHEFIVLQSHSQSQSQHNNNNNDVPPPINVELVCKKMKQVSRLKNFESESEIALELSRYVVEHEYTIHVLLATRTPQIVTTDNENNLEPYWEFEKHIFESVIQSEIEKSISELYKQNEQLVLDGKKPFVEFSDRDLQLYRKSIRHDMIRLDRHRLYIERGYGPLYDIFQPERFFALFGRNVTDQDWFGVLYSMCHTLAVLGNVCEFMHNDAHTMNWFVVPLREHQCWGKSRVVRRVSDNRLQVSLAYRVGEQQLTLTHLDYIVKLGDFSLAETQTHKNEFVQQGKYEIYGISKQYRPGYDWQVFLLSVYSMRERFHLSRSVMNWIKDALDAMEFDWSTMIKTQLKHKLAFCLPTMRQVTRLTPDQFLRDPSLSIPTELMRTNGYRAIIHRFLLPSPPTITTTTNQEQTQEVEDNSNNKSLLFVRGQNQQTHREYENTHEKYNQNSSKNRSGRRSVRTTPHSVAATWNTAATTTDTIRVGSSTGT